MQMNQRLAGLPASRRLGTGGKSSNLLPVSADAFWVRTPSPWGTAIAYRIERNNFTDASSLGSPSQCWRLIRMVEIATVNTDPSSVLFTFSAGTGGANDYAFQRSIGDTQFGGSFHGGETATAMVLLGDGAALDHTVAASFSTFKIARTGGQGRQSTITWDDAQTMSVEFLLTINSDGTVDEAGSFTSTAPFSTQYVGMLAIETTFSQRINSAGTVSTATDSDVTGDASDITYRAPGTGHTVRLTSNIPSATRYSKTRTDNQTTQIKTYPEIGSTAGGAFGTVSYSRRITFGKGEPDPPAVVLIDKNFSDATLTPFVKTQGTNDGVLTGGALQMTRIASGVETRYIAPLTFEAGATYRLTVNASGVAPATHAGLTLCISLASSGTGSGAPFEQLITAITGPVDFVAPQTSLWLVLKQQLGTAAQVGNWFSVKIEKVS